MKTYKLFKSVTEAQQAIAHIDRQMGFNIFHATTKTWATQIESPCTSEALIPYDAVRLAPCNAHFAGVKELTEEDAVNAGWYLGWFRGRFGKAQGKVEEIQYLLDELKSNYGQKPFPYVRAIFFGLTSGLYSVKETLRTLSNARSCEKCSSDQVKWWNTKFHEEIDRPNELLKYILHINNADKHKLHVHLRPIGTYVRDDGVTIASGAEWLASADGLSYVGSEGFFDSTEADMRAFRRLVGDPNVLAKNYGVRSARWTVAFIGLPTCHLGRPLQSTEFLDVLQIVVDYYSNLVTEADRLFGR